MKKGAYFGQSMKFSGCFTNNSKAPPLMFFILVSPDNRNIISDVTKNSPFFPLFSFPFFSSLLLPSVSLLSLRTFNFVVDNEE